MNSDYRKSFEIDKIEAATRQLKEAIRMFFERRDPVAVHTLAYAGHQILHDLCKSKNMEKVLELSLRDYKYVPEDMRNKYRNLLTSTANFIKHADHDADAKRLFSPKITEGFLVDATFLYENLQGNLFYEGSIFRTWFFLKFYKDLPEGELKTKLKFIQSDIIDPDDFDFILSILNLKG